jgi:hypothetical protein
VDETVSLHSPYARDLFLTESIEMRIVGRCFKVAVVDFGAD